MLPSNPTHTVRQLKVFERHHIELIDMHEVSQLRGHRAWSIGHRERQLAAALFGRSVAMSCLDDLKDFYVFYAFYDFYDFYGFFDIPLTFGYSGVRLVTYGFVHLLLAILNI